MCLYFSIPLVCIKKAKKTSRASSVFLWKLDASPYNFSLHQGCLDEIENYLILLYDGMNKSQMYLYFSIPLLCIMKVGVWTQMQSQLGTANSK